MSKAALIIVFNHRYDKNIPVLEKMYAGRFSDIWFLVPFYDGDHPRVIPVYESSNYFQSYFAQGYHRFAAADTTHYIFLGDDCILHPSVNETNLATQTGLPDDTDFIPGIIEFHKLEKDSWWHTFKGIDFFRNRKGAEIKNELPSREEALQRFAAHGIDVMPLSRRNIFGKTNISRKGLPQWLRARYHYNYRWKQFKQNGKLEMPYPVAGAYSDIVIVTAGTIKAFCRYCGIMAAAGLFVEIAIPTALLLSAKKIAQEKDLLLKGKALWTAADISDVETAHGRSLSHLMDHFPGTQLYYHPVKLSRWTNDL
ncbi:MAG: hypothetical protein EOO09_18310 [Chitinophagaceae bacterium]|nr:MAG: hypothetical protein EOO09_18310 [Chitinophagaceae bacterium]